MKDLVTPRDQRYFEDYPSGAECEYGPIAVEEAEVVSFAKRFDPQAMHVDPEGAKRGLFGGLIASGWHTSCLLMRLYVDHYISAVASVASPGIDELRWPKPVRPGDRLRLRVRIGETRLSKSKPDRGLVYTQAAGINQNDEVISTFTAMNLFLVRPPAKP